MITVAEAQIPVLHTRSQVDIRTLVIRQQTNPFLQKIYMALALLPSEKAALPQVPCSLLLGKNPAPTWELSRVESQLLISLPR